MPRKEIIAPEALGRSNPSLSPATRFGDLVFVSGQTGRNPATGEVGADVTEQTRNVLERIKICLEDAGTSLDNVLTATCWLKDAGDFAAFNAVYNEYFTEGKPARATVQATLMGQDLVVEIMVTACIPS